jgi:hypothetical protein
MWDSHSSAGRLGSGSISSGSGRVALAKLGYVVLERNKRPIGKPARNWWKWRDKAYDAGIRPTYWNRGLIELPNQVLRTAEVSWRFGGQRFYFVCECGRRVEKLHAFRDRPWRCRHCYQLTYATRRAVPRHRHVIKVQKIREHLGGSLSLLDGFPPKPKGMHRKRYERLRRRHDAATQQGMGMTAAYLAGLRGRR